MNETTTVETVKKLFSYESETGLLFRITPRGKKKLIRSRSTNGYLIARVHGRLIAAHRIAWAIHYGKWPDGEIDHVNRVKDDNRIGNLRDISHDINMHNIERREEALRLVGPIPCGDKWEAVTIKYGERHSLGIFDTIEQARRAWNDDKRFARVRSKTKPVLYKVVL